MNFFVSVSLLLFGVVALLVSSSRRIRPFALVVAALALGPCAWFVYRDWSFQRAYDRAGTGRTCLGDTYG